MKNLSGLNGNAQEISVSAVTLDGYLESWTPDEKAKLKVVKCDVEGAEVLVLDGAKALLRDPDAPIWFIEHNRSALTEHGFASQDLCSRFAGYSLFFIPLSWPPSIRSVEKAQAARDPALLPDECNILAIPERGKHGIWLKRLSESGAIECQP